MTDISPAARAAYDAIAASQDGLRPQDVPVSSRRLGARAIVLGELVEAGLIAFSGGRYRTTGKDAA